MKIRGISRTVVALGLVALLNDMASEMLYPIIPLFIVGTLGQTPGMLGIIEGIAEGIATGLRWVGGVLSDLSRKRKPFVVWGYSVSALSKPVMGLAGWFGGWPMFLAGRASDRLGKSIRTAARDALIAEATEEGYRGVAFGFHRAMDTCGAVLGPLAAAAVLYFRPQTQLGWLFFIATAPGLVCALVAQLGVKDVPHEKDVAGARAKTRFWQDYPRGYWILLLATGLFSLGNSSDSFLIVRSAGLFAGKEFAKINYASAEAAGVVVLSCLLYVAYNIVYAAAATPMGKLSDVVGRKPVMIAGWIIYGLVYIGFSVASAPWMAWGLFLGYGLYQALTDGVSKAMVTDLVGKNQKGGAIGLFYTVSGVGQLAGSVLGGALWEYKVGPMMWTFFLGAVFAVASVPLLLMVPEKKSDAA